MDSSPKSVKYHVQVVRLRFDAAIIEVDATDDSDAERKAVEQAQRLSDADWQLQPFDHNSYQPHAESMVAEDELMESEEVGDALDPERYAVPPSQRRLRRRRRRYRLAAMA